MLITPHDAPRGELDGLLSVAETRAANQGGGVRATTVPHYDDAHLLDAVARAGQSVTYTRAVDGQVHTEAGPGGTVTYGYDASTQRLKSVQGPWGVTATDVAWEAGGERLASLSDGTLTECWRYDDAGRLSGIDSAQGYTWCDTPTLPWLTSRGYTYDGRGNRKTEQEATSGKTRYFSYDDADRLVGWTEWDGSAGVLSLLPDGRRDVEKRFPPATRTQAASFLDPGEVARFSFGYDGQGALTSRLDTLQAQAAITFAVDGEGRVRSKTVGGAMQTYEWNADGRLVQTAGVTYEYDAQGLRRKATAAGGVRSWAWAGEDGEEAASEAPQGGAGQYLDQFGRPIPANVPVIGPRGVTQSGVPSDVRRALTHFKNTD